MLAPLLRADRFRGAFLRTLCAVATTLSPALAAHAQPPAATGDAPALRRLVQTPQSVAVIRLAPRAVLTAPETRLYPIEIATAAGLEYVGVDPLDIELVEAVIEPPLGTRMFYGVAVRFTRPFDLERLNRKVWEHCEGEADGAGGVRYVSRDPNLPSFEMADEQTLLIASPGMLKKLARPGRSTDGAFLDWVDGLDRSLDLHAAVNFEALRPLVQMGLAAQADEIPEEARRYLPMLDDLRFIEAGTGFQPRQRWRLAIEANDADAADRLQNGLAEWGREVMKEFIEGVTEELPDDVIGIAGRRWVARVSLLFADALTPVRHQNRLVLEAPNEHSDPSMDKLAQAGTIGVLVAVPLLLPAVQAAREAARRTQSMNNMKQMGIALHNFHDANGAFPPPAITSPDGRELLSWRVAILPHLGQQELYNAFRLDEPWDSPHNRALIPRMPPMLLDPSGGLAATEGKTHYLGVVGPNAAFRRDEPGMQLRRFRDGASKTAWIFQVDDAHAVPWTKPADYDTEAHRENPIAGIGALHPGVFLVGFADAHVQAVATDVDADWLRAVMTADGQEIVDVP